MAIFFLIAGIEIKYEILYGGLSTIKKASFPIISAIGGVIVPAVIFILFNYESTFLKGAFIPISTDIAFAIGLFLIFKNKINPSLKVFLLSLAVVDDLISIVIIGLFFSNNINIIYLALSLFILFLLFLANRVYKINDCLYYLISGLCLWYFIYLSNIHPTISGVLLAMVMPSAHESNKVKSVSRKFHKFLSPINGLFIIPLFIICNTAITIDINTKFSINNSLFLGIIFGLCIGKPLGIMLFSFVGSLFRITEKPTNCDWLSIFYVALISGIGFTMSIFMSEIVFLDNINLINISKLSILISAFISILSAVITIQLTYSLKTIYVNLFKKI